MLTICVLILIGLYFRKPIGDLVEKLKSVDWAQKFAALWQYVLSYAKKAGRVATKPILQFYYVVTDSETSTLEKALIYGCIAYVVMPFNFTDEIKNQFKPLLLQVNENTHVAKLNFNDQNKLLSEATINLDKIIKEVDGMHDFYNKLQDFTATAINETRHFFDILNP